MAAHEDQLASYRGMSPAQQISYAREMLAEMSQDRERDTCLALAIEDSLRALKSDDAGMPLKLTEILVERMAVVDQQRRLMNVLDVLSEQQTTLRVVK